MRLKFAILFLLPLGLAAPTPDSAAPMAPGIHCHAGVPWINPGSSAANPALRPGDCQDALDQFRRLPSTDAQLLNSAANVNFTTSATITDGSDGIPRLVTYPQVYLPRSWTNGSCQVRLALRSTYTENSDAAKEIFNGTTLTSDLETLNTISLKANDLMDQCTSKGQGGWLPVGRKQGLAFMIIGSQADIGNVAGIE